MTGGVDIGIFIYLILLGIVSWRLSHLISIENGPGDAFLKLRLLTGAYDTDDGWDAQTFWGKLIICPLCLSVWLAVVLYVVDQAYPIMRPGIYVLAISGVASFMQLMVKD